MPDMFRRPLIPILLCFVGGILFGHIAFPCDPPFVLLISLLLAFFLLFSLFIPSRFKFPCFLVLFFLAGTDLDLNQHQPSELLPLAERHARVTIEGTVLEPPKMMTDMARVVVWVDRLLFEGKESKVQEKLIMTIYGHTQPSSPGDKIRFQAKLRPFKNFNNPGRYDYELAMSSKGLSCAASISDGRRIVPMGPGRLGFPMTMFEGIRKPIRHFLREKLAPQNEALFKALILGERQGISPELRESFHVAGLSHVLAVSGLHIALVAWISFTLFRTLLSLSYRLALKTDIRKLAAIMTCFPVVAYTCLTGFQVSSQRAMIMALAYLFSMVLGREKEVWSTLALAAFVVLAIDPHAIFSVSFQLSFPAVVGILWLAPEIHKKLTLFAGEGFGEKRVIHRLHLYVAGLVAVTLSAMVFLLPITTFYFHRLSVVAVPANLMVVPVLGLYILPLGLMGAVSLPFSSWAARLFFQAGSWGLDWVMEMIEFWTRFQWANLWVLRPNIFEIGLFYALIFSLFFLKRWPWAKLGLGVTLFLIGTDVSYWVYRTQFNRELKITYLDVGQGNAALVQFPGRKRMLIDGGGFSKGEFDVGKMVVAPYLFRSKIRRIDYLVLSHPQMDHMDGLRFIAKHFEPKEFWSNSERVETSSFMKLMKIVEAKKIRKVSPADLVEGREIAGVKIQLLHPVPDKKDRPHVQRAMNLNDTSLVLKLSYGEISCLFAGDLERAGEAMVVSRAGRMLKSDILLAPHHGGRTSCSKPFLDMVQPRVCIISSGRSNPSRFPNEQTLQRLQAAGCRIMRTNQVGAVQLCIRSNDYKIRSFLK
jgi:competence protein ComEC